MSNSIFPIGLDTFINPNSSDSENEQPIPHNLQHGLANDAIAALETKVGINSSNIQASLDYLVKSAANPGHTHTAAMSIQSLTILGATSPSGAGIWSDGTNIILNNGGSSGGVILRPSGATNSNYQFSVTALGVVATSTSSGTSSNVLDDGSGNINISGSAVIKGSLTVNGSFASAGFDYGSPSNSAVNDVASAGVQISIARSDHVHGREGFSNALPQSAGLANAGSSSQPARSDHIHPSETLPGVVQMWAGSSAPAGYLLCQGGVVSQTTYANLYAEIGTLYNTGGEGAGNFRLPNFSGRSPIGVGSGAGLTTRALAAIYGAEINTLNAGQLPSHVHGYTPAGSISNINTDHAHFTYQGNGFSAIYSSPAGTGSGWMIANGTNQPTNGGWTSSLANTTATQSATNWGSWSQTPTFSGSASSTNGGPGTSASIPNVSPVLGINFIIKY